MKLFVTGISFKTAPVNVRERIAVPASAAGCAGCRLKVRAGLSEVVLLSTCNRVEIYGAASDASRVEELMSILSPSGPSLSTYTYTHYGEDAVRYLFSVAAGLDSMVIGETEITGQVKNAYEAAQKMKLTGRVTNGLFQKALQAAKAIRTRTQIGRGATSVGSVAVQLAEKIFDSQLRGKSVVILGAGQMGEACVRHLAKKGVGSVTVANRSVERARKLAEEFGGTAVGLDACQRVITGADIVVAAAGGDTLLDRGALEAIMRERRNRPLFLIDIAVPRNIDPAAGLVDNVFLYNVDHLEEIVSENTRLREMELRQCRQIIDEIAAELMARLSAAPGRPPAAGSHPQPDWWPCQPARCPQF